MIPLPSSVVGALGSSVSATVVRRFFDALQHNSAVQWSARSGVHMIPLSAPRAPTDAQRSALDAFTKGVEPCKRCKPLEDPDMNHSVSHARSVMQAFGFRS